ncbi:MAG TPA: 3-hydroxybutyrate oligomer hydrolase family protein [Geminicoccaceae bacterium]|nr:3-hydroxybutyrate oligomer hydrolase family protein [Geminicoccaceae bacterium]
MWTPRWSRMLLGSAGILLAAGTAWAGEPPPAAVPGFVNGQVLINEYPSGGDNDLLTGGLGAAGLQRPPSGPPVVYPPPVSSPPTAEELRTLAIYNNYRALVDTTSGGGYGWLYGPLVGPTTADAEGKIYGVEYLAYAKGRGGDQNVTLMVQIPEAFDPAKACVVTGPSSGSRGIYGAIGTSGEWGLKKGCAVAYTDKGTGTGAHDLERDMVSLLRGERVPADEAGERSNFTAPISDAERLAFNARHPDRWAWKHAHSELNPEADWDRHVLLSLEFALWALNDRYGGARLTWGNTLVIASSSRTAAAPRCARPRSRPRA